MRSTTTETILQMLQCSTLLSNDLTVTNRCWDTECSYYVSRTRALWTRQWTRVHSIKSIKGACVSWYKLTRHHVNHDTMNMPSLIPAPSFVPHIRAEKFKFKEKIDVGQMVKSSCVELVRQSRSAQGHSRAIRARQPLNQGSSLTAAQVRGQGEVKVCLTIGNEFTNMCGSERDYLILTTSHTYKSKFWKSCAFNVGMEELTGH